MKHLLYARYYTNSSYVSDVLFSLYLIGSSYNNEALYNETIGI